jgi:hypothetical protein
MVPAGRAVSAEHDLRALLVQSAAAQRGSVRTAVRQPGRAGGDLQKGAPALDALLEAKIHLSEIVPSGFSSDEDDDDEEPTEETEASLEEVLQYAWETVCYVIWGKASAKGGQKVMEAAPEELKDLYRQILIPITENLEGSGGLL